VAAARRHHAAGVEPRARPLAANVAGVVGALATLLTLVTGGDPARCGHQWDALLV
jgi:hypothetical protein